MIVTIGVPTFRRTDRLGPLLAALAAQRDELQRAVPESGDIGLGVRVVVVDNDPSESARPALHDAPAWVTYVPEPRPGISAVRNRLMDEAPRSDGADGPSLLAFIDDDEMPEPGWLVALVRTWQATGAAAVAGRVVPNYLTPPDPWLVAGEFFVRRTLPTGTRITATPTGNLLLDLDQVRARGLSFDESFGLSGGEDTRFSADLIASGARIVFCAESVVLDDVPAQRLTRRWVLARALSHGNTTGLLALTTGHDAPHVRTRLRLLGGGLARAAVGSGRALLGVATRNDAHEAKGLRLVLRGSGIALAGAGFTYEEYARDGRRLRRTAPNRRDRRPGRPRAVEQPVQRGSV